MATNFPSSLDNLTNPTASDKLNSVTVPHATQHANVNDAVEALEAKVGVDGSAVTSSHDYILTNGVLPTLNVDSGVLVVDDTNNRVGVNDATPSYALDVTGDINATGDLRIGGTAIGDYIDYSGSVTFNNFTLGNGSVSSYYTRVNDLVHFVGAVTLGSTSSVTGNWSVNLPVNNAFEMVGHGFVHFNDTGTDIYLGTLSTGAGSASFKWFGVTGGKVSDSGVNATLPFTWTTNDFLRWDLLYRAA